MKPAQLLDTVPATIATVSVVLSLTFGFWSLSVEVLGAFCVMIHFMSFPEKVMSGSFLGKS